MTWALLPPYPKELTLARRTPVSLFQSITSVGTSILSPLKSMAGLGVLKYIFGKILADSTLIVALIMPARPDAPSRCPKFDLTEPT